MTGEIAWRAATLSFKILFFSQVIKLAFISMAASIDKIFDISRKITVDRFSKMLYGVLTFFEEGDHSVKITSEMYVETLLIFLKLKLGDHGSLDVRFQQDWCTAHTARRSI